MLIHRHRVKIDRIISQTYACKHAESLASLKVYVSCRNLKRGFMLTCRASEHESSKEQRDIAARLRKEGSQCLFKTTVMMMKPVLTSAMVRKLKKHCKLSSNLPCFLLTSSLHLLPSACIYLLCITFKFLCAKRLRTP